MFAVFSMLPVARSSLKIEYLLLKNEKLDRSTLNNHWVHIVTSKTPDSKVSLLPFTNCVAFQRIGENSTYLTTDLSSSSCQYTICRYLLCKYSKSIPSAGKFYS